MYGKSKRVKALRKRNRRSYKKRSSMRRKPYQTRFVRITRWSNLDNTNSCHLTIAGSASGNNIGTTVFKLNDLPNNNELVALFDNYCIRNVKYRWVLLRDPSAFQTTAGTQGIFSRITWVHDFNDSNPQNRNVLMQYPKMKEYFFSDTKQATPWMTLKPAALTVMFETGLQTAYKPTWGAFVDTLDTQMAHYGIKYAYNNLFEGNTILMEAKVTLDFKGIS